MSKTGSLCKPLVLIPAAGFGRRVGSPEAKELLLRPDGTHLIDLPLQCAGERGWPVHVVTRPEKKTLVRYLQQIPYVTVQEIGPTFDWPETLLASEPYWHEWNLVFLPDMEFKPRHALDEMALAMTGEADLVTANHLVPELNAWGVLWPEISGLTLGEKVSVSTSEPRWAWGLYGFRREVGRKILEAQLASCRDHRLRQLPIRGASVKLQEFRDLTRDGY